MIVLSPEKRNRCLCRAFGIVYFCIRGPLVVVPVLDDGVHRQPPEKTIHGKDGFEIAAPGGQVSDCTQSAPQLRARLFLSSHSSIITILQEDE